MTFDSDRVTTITFDSYSTLVDVEAAIRALADHVDDPGPVSTLWRLRSLEYTLVANHVDAYQPFYEMNRDALQYALDVFDADVTEDERDEILAVYHELDVFDDVRDGIERLRDGGYDCYVVSNGDPDMLSSMVAHADVDDLLEDTISADEIETYKPAADLYRHAAGRTGTPIDEIVHVTAGWYDVMGAKHAGMQGAWVDRKGRPWEPIAGDPDLTIGSFHELADELGV
ncbi:haloacid dehalogenase type II [Natrinema sp. 1APR25-10V2]|uniref:haloacid dehalogenase type II n=1 Tax=Natrinema sp. 1APR25-10V2 TaxID=2951081 RepID=UPI002874C6DB|nr:haloacid dehalogenase type II [Natrinema sp. 1APR25-10V2]MDS0475468.1 haloacid dehalogenase type II [Natrinema sp. 1APR25-10V2]